MRTICDPSYANIVMSECEEEHIYPLIKNKSVIYLRYIDNIFSVWIKYESEIRHFMNEMNQNHQSIKFDFKFSKRKYRISGHISVHRQQEQTSDHPLRKANRLSKLFTCQIGKPVLT